MGAAPKTNRSAKGGVWSSPHYGGKGAFPTFEDKILQRAVSMILGSVCEEDFRSCSYGDRPGRSAHDGLSHLRENLIRVGGGWGLELDIEDFFGSLDRGYLREILRQRVRDGVLLRLIGKRLHVV